MFSIPAEFILFETEHWIVNHRIDSALPGYLMLASKKNTTNLSDLDKMALDELGHHLASLQKAVTDLLNPSHVYIGRYGHVKGWSLHFHIIPVYEWVSEAFEKNPRYRMLEQFYAPPAGNEPLNTSFDAGDMTLYIWREFCESKTPPAIVGPSVAVVIQLLRKELGSFKI